MYNTPIKLELVAIVRNYEIRVGSIESYSSLHVLKTDRGTKILRVWPNVELMKETFTFRELLATSGFRKIERFIRTKSNQAYVIDKGVGYSLTDMIDGLGPTVNRDLDMETIGNTLGKFHLALSKAKVEKPFNPWSIHFEQGLQLFEKTEEILNKKKDRDSLDELIFKDMLHHKEQIKQSIQMAKRTERLYFQKGMEPRYCHGNLNMNSFKIDEFGEGWITDIGLPVVDIPAYDIAKLATRIYLKNGMNIEGIKKLLTHYDKVLPLKAEDKLWILTYIAYPHDLWKLIHVTYKTKVTRPKDIHKHYLKLIENQFHLDKLYQELFSYFNL